nr:hypothetical protein [Ancylobacter crimeensis]
MPRPALAFAALSAALLASPLAVLPAEAAAPAGSLWPCIQPRVQTLAAGQMWDGPSIDNNLAWRDDAQVAELVPVIVARRTTIEDATARIETFATAAGPQKNARLTLLFAGAFDQINSLRARILTGIERYAQHQIDLSNRIKDESLRFAQAKKTATTDEARAKLADIEQQVVWDTRIYDSRTQAMSAVCESPVILEQRAFALARAIRGLMD